MNIQDFEAPQAEGNLLEHIFNRQKELIVKYHDIEAQSGIFNYQDGDVPVNIHTLSGQVRLKDFAWRAMEEIAEALDGHSIEHQQEEISDALHFLTEMYLLAGYDSDFFGDLRDLYRRAGSEDYLRYPDVPSRSRAVTRFVYALGNAMNKLKNKPWKQSQMLTDVPAFEAYLLMSMLHFVEVAISFGIHSPEFLFDLYFRKSEVNKFRQRSGY